MLAMPRGREWAWLWSWKCPSSPQDDWLSTLEAVRRGGGFPCQIKGVVQITSWWENARNQRLICGAPRNILFLIFLWVPHVYTKKSLNFRQIHNLVSIKCPGFLIIFLLKIRRKSRKSKKEEINNLRGFCLKAEENEHYGFRLNLPLQPPTW